MQGLFHFAPALDGFSTRVLKSATVPVGCVDLCEYQFDRPIETTLNLPYASLDLALSPRFDGAKGCYLTGKNPQDRAVGNIVFFAPNRPIHGEWGQGVQRTIRCIFGDDLESPGGWSRQALMAGLDIRDPVLRDMLIRLARELTTPDFASQVMIETLWIQIQLQIKRFFQIEHPDAARPVGQLAGRQVRMIEDWIDSASGPFTISDISNALGMSGRHLARLFRASTGLTISQFAVERQIAKAKCMLSAGKSVKIVSWACGFETASAFSTAFRKAVGIPPREYARTFRMTAA